MPHRVPTRGEGDGLHVVVGDDLGGETWPTGRFSVGAASPPSSQQEAEVWEVAGPCPWGQSSPGVWWGS